MKNWNKRNNTGIYEKIGIMKIGISWWNSKTPIDAQELEMGDPTTTKNPPVVVAGASNGYNDGDLNTQLGI